MHHGLIHPTGTVAEATIVPQEVLAATVELATTLAAGLAAGIH